MGVAKQHGTHTIHLLSQTGAHKGLGRDVTFHYLAHSIYLCPQLLLKTFEFLTFD